MIKEGYYHSSNEDKEDFFQGLQERGLIVRDAENGWKVNENNLCHKS
jgi:hypothetical protein